jgi:hypothetical protein
LLLSCAAFAQTDRPEQAAPDVKAAASPSSPARAPVDEPPKASPPPEQTSLTPAAPHTEKPGPWTRWTTFLKSEGERILATDPYGASFQLPKGYLKFGYKWASLHGDSRFDNDGHLGPVIPRLQFQVAGQTQLSVDFGVAGHGGSHTFDVGYGILDNLGWYATIPFNYMSVQTNLQVNAVDDQGNHIGSAAASLLGVTDRKAYGPANFVYQTLPQLGRPPLGSSFLGMWLLGDVDTGVAWNYFRNARLSGALTGHLFLPTAHIPPPERDILYATGPELEAGTGGWGVGATQTYDVRLYRSQWVQVVAGGDLSAVYHFPQERPYPTNFIKPQPAAAGLSPQAFPDLCSSRGASRSFPVGASEFQGGSTSRSPWWGSRWATASAMARSRSCKETPLSWAWSTRWACWARPKPTRWGSAWAST